MVQICFFSSFSKKNRKARFCRKIVIMNQKFCKFFSSISKKTYIILLEIVIEKWKLQKSVKESKNVVSKKYD